ncbi:hypothetical protein ACF9IK_34855 [Kitasatospora hibisci]|uniref:hypothetical protein n=1 Tax=Kitasatospora hibisci TaxID=3369522 RepID=UPI00375418CB
MNRPETSGVDGRTHQQRAARPGLGARAHEVAPAGVPDRRAEGDGLACPADDIG